MMTDILLSKSFEDYPINIQSTITKYRHFCIISSLLFTDKQKSQESDKSGVLTLFLKQVIS